MYSNPIEKHLQCARIGRGKHQKAWKQEIRREQNSNPLPETTHSALFATVLQMFFYRINFATRFIYN